MKKKLRNCTYKEVKDYNASNCDLIIRSVLAVFHSSFIRNETSWKSCMKYDFKYLFNKKVLDYEIEV